MSRHVPWPDRFWSKVDASGDCWIWTGAHDQKGYGHGRDEKLHHQKAHRVAYELLVGTIPVGYQIDHLCRTRDCVNPDHLETVTPATNQRRGYSPAGHNSRKSHCAKGHPFTADNIYISRGKRYCATCARAKSRHYYWLARGAA